MSVPEVQNHSFQAAWPKALDPKLESMWKKVARVAWLILSIIIFPIGLARLAVWGLRSLAVKMVHPYIKDFGQTESASEGRGNDILDDLGGHRVTLTTPTGVKLDAAYIPGKVNKTIIYFPGLANKWQHADEERIEQMRQTGASILMVNSRWHTHDNPLPDEEGLALDGWTAFDYLVKKGVPKEEILFFGHSMGATVATLGAGMAQEEFPDSKIKLVNWNSFHSLASTGKQLISRHMKICCGLQGIGSHLAYWGLRTIGNIDVTEALSKIKEKTIIWNKGDQTIFRPSQAIHAAENGYSFEMQDFENSWEHDRDFEGTEKLALQAVINRHLNIHLSEGQNQAFRRHVTVI